MLRNKRVINGLLVVTFFLGYLEWGSDNHAFVFQAAAELFSALSRDLVGLLHPFILIPLAGLLIMLYTLFQHEPSRKLTLLALACLAMFMLFLFFIGLISLNVKITLSTIPFLGLAALCVRLNWRSAAG
ncbi:MAG: hypothetical protein KIT62_02520 [Cyclobacteriaceae bacterium]|nr:hypothetical protein [Cyclobacteriaceae bacterium]